jgi:hypothetical protein
VAQGIVTKPSVEVATTANLTATYDNGTLGVGATLTATGNGAFPAIDGVTLTSTTPGENGVLVKNQSAPAQNGRYNLTQVGNGSAPWILTRCGLCDEADEIPGAYVFVKQGTLYKGTGWIQTVTNPATFTVGTDAIIVTQFSGAGSFSAGTGLTLTETTFSVNADQTFNSVIVNGANLRVGGTGQRASTAGTALVNIFNGTAPAGALTNGISLYSASGDFNFMDATGNGYKVGYRNVPAAGSKNSSYILAVGDVGKYVQVTAGGAITIPNSTFAEGDVISIFNNTGSNVTLTCSISTAYVAGTDADKATIALSTRGVATILFISPTVCVVSGNVS